MCTCLCVAFPVCMHIGLYACVPWICNDLYMYIYIYLCVCLCMGIFLDISLSVCMRVLVVYERMHIWRWLCVDECVCGCMCACMYCTCCVDVTDACMMYVCLHFVSTCLYAFDMTFRKMLTGLDLSSFSKRIIGWNYDSWLPWPMAVISFYASLWNLLF